jgi:hypothetical protein
LVNRLGILDARIQASPGVPFEVFTAVPELEAVFLHDRFVFI